MTDTIKSTISPWMPEQDQIRLAILGKLGEEASELAQRCFRCIIHGLDELDPDTGRTNRVELEREISDVIACIVTSENNRISNVDANEAYDKRVNDKVDGFKLWHGMIYEGKKSG